MNKLELKQKKERLEQKDVKTECEQESACAAPTLPVNVDCFILESEKSSNCSSDELLQLYKETAEKLKECVKNMLMNRDKVETHVQYMLQLGDLCIKLKELNRLNSHKLKKSRDMLIERKEKLEKLCLKQENLLREERYLQVEINKCSSARSIYQDIELVPVEQFYAEAPKNISKEEITKNNSHALLKAQLRWELEQRRRLAAKVKLKELRKESTKKKIKQLQECLQNIQPTLRKILEISKNLDTKLGMQHIPTKLKHKKANYLPAPLLNLYVEMCAYQEACDENIQVYVDGDMHGKAFHQEVTDCAVEESLEIDGSKKSACDECVVCETNSILSDTILNKHPLSVCLDIVEADAKIVLQFAYLTYLGIVTVIVKSFSAQSTSSVTVSNFLEVDTFMCDLFPGDDGKQSPNPTTKYLLYKHKFEKDPLFDNVTGLPYLWAQKISKLNFHPAGDVSNVSSDFETCSVMRKTMLATKSRMRTRVSLNTQIHSLEQGAEIPKEISVMFPSNVQSRVTKLNPVSWRHVEQG